MPNDFNIPMTDAQITQALQLMVERVSEGWAQETYDGSPVGSGSPYYHKSSKYWATRSEDAAARAEAAVPAGTAGAVFFDRAQTLTTAQQEQARQNIMAGGSNRNLLDNPFFSVNQRSFTSSTGTNGVQIVDRWYINNGTGGTTSVETGGIKLNANSGSSYISLEQRVPVDYTGKTLTISLLLSDGTIISATGTAPTRNTSYQTFARNADIMGLELRFTAVPSSVATYAHVATVIVLQGYSFTVKAIKVELGSVSTLANDAPPCYAEELAKCQRYFVRLSADTAYGMLGMGIVNNADGTSAWVMFNLPVTMRRFPDTMTYGGSFRTLAGVNGALVTGTVSRMSISTNASNRNVARIDILGTGFGQFGTPFMFGANNDASAHIDISADL